MDTLCAACDRATVLARHVSDAVARTPGAELRTEVRFYAPGEEGVPPAAWRAAAATFARTWTAGALLQVQETVCAEDGGVLLFSTLACGAGGCDPATLHRQERLIEEEVLLRAASPLDASRAALCARVSLVVEHTAHPLGATAAPLRVRVRQMREFWPPPCDASDARGTAAGTLSGAIALAWSAPSASVADAAMSHSAAHEVLLRVRGGARADLASVASVIAGALLDHA